MLYHIFEATAAGFGGKLMEINSNLVFQVSYIFDEGADYTSP